MEGEQVESDPVAARREYLRQQEREKKRRQRARKRAAKNAHNAGLEVPFASPVDGGQVEDQRPEVASDPPRKLGRPKIWTEDKALKWKAFLLEMIESGKTLTATLRKHPQGPSIDTVWRWLREDATFAAGYERAKTSAADAFFFQSVDIADAATGDAAAISAARLRVDSRRYAAAKLKPEKYGDRSEVQHTGAVQHVITDDERARALMAFVARQAISAAQSLPEVKRLIEAKTIKDQPET